MSLWLVDQPPVSLILLTYWLEKDLLTELTKSKYSPFMSLWLVDQPPVSLILLTYWLEKDLLTELTKSKYSPFSPNPAKKD